MTYPTTPFNGVVRALLMPLFWYQNKADERLGRTAREEYERHLLEKQSPNVFAIHARKRRKV
jgi:hypothetical protein